MKAKLYNFLKKFLPGLRTLQYTGLLIRHPKFIIDYRKFKNGLVNTTPKIRWRNIVPKIGDNTSSTKFDTHYIYHPAWAARIVKHLNPDKHVDISSTLHFSTQLSAFIPTEFYDYRPAKINLSNLHSGSADLCKLHFEDNSIESLSCMHTVEHIGLGRYGDAIDPEGDKTAINELQRVLKKGGSLLFVTPVGQARIEFNAHRVYDYEQVIQAFDKLELVEFSLVPDDALEKGFIENADPDLAAFQKYGCGCFWFKKV